MTALLPVFSRITRLAKKPKVHFAGAAILSRTQFQAGKGSLRGGPFRLAHRAAVTHDPVFFRMGAPHKENILLTISYDAEANESCVGAAMSADWKEQLQQIIELSRDRIRRLEAGAADDAPSSGIDATRQIEAEEKTIARLQRTIEALN